MSALQLLFIILRELREFDIAIDPEFAKNLHDGRAASERGKSLPLSLDRTDTGQSSNPPPEDCDSEWGRKS